MGGLAVIIDWHTPVDPEGTLAMMDLAPHRSPAGRRTARTRHATLSEGRTHEPHAQWDITSAGPVTIVGDFRLWHRGRVRSLAGGASSTVGFDDRALILCAYRRSGWKRMLDALDGDFAFVIWDAEERLTLAARDRFGVMPLFFSRTATGIRFATEPKQLVGNSPLDHLDAHAIANHLAGRPAHHRETYFAGVNRVMPSEAIMATESAFERTVYWTPEPESNTGLTKQDAPHLFREHLVDAVARRLDSSTRTVSQLSGGLDSTSIAASANILTASGTAHETFATVSAVFPGSPSDESDLINEVVASQPFTHRSFVVETATLDDYATVMRQIDGPRVSPTHPLETGTGEFAQEVGADLILTGLGGDYVLDNSQLLVDLLKNRSPHEWWRLARRTSASRNAPMLSVVIPSLLSATPERAKLILRRLGANPIEPEGLMTAELRSHHGATDPDPGDSFRSYPSRTQRTTVTGVRSSPLAQINEYVEARLSRFGLAVSHPYLDRDLIEFVASIPVNARPSDGRSKSLVRRAFAESLPESVLTKPRKTMADDYLLSQFTTLGSAFTDRYPSVPDIAQQFVDAERYVAALRGFESSEATLVSFKVLWPVWTLFLWLDSLRSLSDDAARDAGTDS